MATKDRTSLKNDFANGKYATGEKFADLIDSMKVVQLPVVDPQALGTSLSFIDSISQDADGKITATKKTLDLANAHEFNPFKGWYKTGDTLPTAGFDGAYLYFKDTSEQTGLTTIYRWNGTTYADTGTVVDTSNVQTFKTGQAVNGVKIKDENGVDDAGAEGVLSAEAGKRIGDEVFGTYEYQDMAGIQPMKYYSTYGLSIGSQMGSNPKDSSSASAYGCIRVECLEGDKFRLYGTGGNQYGYLWVFTDSDRVILEIKDVSNYHSDGDILDAPTNSHYLYINFYQYNSQTDKLQKRVKWSGLSDTVSELEERVSELEDENIPNVIDSLDSSSATDALSAKQGKILNDYSNGLAGFVIEDVASHAANNAIIRNVVKRIWIEVLDDSVVLPEQLRLYGFRNRSEGTGNKFIVQFNLPSNFTPNGVIFNGSNANKQTGECSLVVSGHGYYNNKANIHIDLDFSQESGDINWFGNYTDCYIYTQDANKTHVYTESVKDAVKRLDEQVSSLLPENPVKYPLGDISGVGTMGASLMFNGNNWVEDGCSLCGVTSYNKAESGVGVPSYFANKIWRGTYCTDEEFENMDILAIQFASSGDVYTGQFFDTSEEYTKNFDLSDPSNQFYTTYTNAQCLDYILKYWQERCYADRNNASSKWYGTQYGKPCRLMFVTHWHDARVSYNDSIRQVAAKWGGGICEFDKKIGFSKNQTINGLQPSVIFANETKTIDGIDYGWHPLRGQAGKYIQTKMANIFASSLMEYFGAN